MSAAVKMIAGLGLARLESNSEKEPRCKNGWEAFGLRVESSGLESAADITQARTYVRDLG